VMYGAEWCAHCQNQKKEFGDSFRLVSYVECPQNTQTCLEKGISGYPTWILADGQKLVGEQELEKLSQKTGCALPQAK
ncbi:MAG: thioredoxin domain-containing protein, partial [Patescibacteria group bacterium]